MSVHAWELICFLIFVGFIAKPVRGFLFNYLNDYSYSIKKNIDDAIHLKNDALENFACYEQKHKEFEDILKDINNTTAYSIKKLRRDSKISLEEKTLHKLQTHKEALKVQSEEYTTKARMLVSQLSSKIVKEYLKEHSKKISLNDTLNDTLHAIETKNDKVI